ncbi:MAG: hypothetical protein KDA24_19565 [Deltaproteobacteria bacterium]|nr:hypothetical protein [Deltaproteobacteria bacterium]
MSGPSRPVLGGVLFAAACTAIIALTAGRLGSFDTVGPTVAFAYPWRLTDPTTAARWSAWAGYALHNVIAWLIIAQAQRSKLGFGKTFRSANWWMLGTHAVFIGLHIVQTQLFYDGLAQDVPEITALGSVALMLMVVLILEAPRRGLVFGKSLPFSKRFLRVVKHTHGYLFTWALIYTFWYHPTEGTFGHLAGFFYIFLLLWQSVLLFHRAHLDKRWTLALEMLVLPHGVLVAIHQGQGLWPMFAFGFGAVFVLTQLWGTGLSSLARRAVVAACVVGAVATYVGLDRLDQWHEIVRIPVLDYMVVLVLWGLYAVVNTLLVKMKLLPPEETT